MARAALRPAGLGRPRSDVAGPRTAVEEIEVGRELRRAARRRRSSRRPASCDGRDVNASPTRRSMRSRRTRRPRSTRGERVVMATCTLRTRDSGLETDRARAAGPAAVMRRPWVPSKSCAPRSRRPPPSCATAAGRGRRADARAAEAGRLRRLLDERRDAARAGCSARRRARSPSGWRRRCRARSATRLDRVEVAGPGFLNLFLADAWYVARARRRARRRRGFGARRAGAAREGPRRVRLRQPDRPADRRQRAPRRLRRRARADPRARRPRGQREYYFNDAGSQIERLGESIRARARGEEVPEDGYEGDYVDELARGDPGRRRPRRRPSSRAAASSDHGRHPGDARAPTACTSTRWFSERSLHDGEPSAGRARDRAARGAGPRLPLRGRAVAAHDDVRRRQGPRARALERRARPTSPPTSPTTRTSSSAATTA